MGSAAPRGIPRGRKLKCFALTLAPAGLFARSAGARLQTAAPNDPAFPFQPSSSLGIGNLGRNTSREPGFVNVNLSVFKGIPIGERLRLELRFEAYNAFNHVNFAGPASANIDNANYGLITGSAPARQMQIGARLSF